MAGGGALGAAAKDAVDEVSLGGDKPRPKISDLARLLWLLLRRSVVVTLGVMLMIVVFGAVWRAVELPHEREVTVDHIETLKRSGEEIAAALADNPRALEWFQAHQAELGKYANSKESCPDPDRPKWDWSGSLYFSFTVVSTIGYGTFGPATDVGKAMVVVLGLVGILLFGLGLGLISAAFDDVLDTVVLYMCSGFSEGRQITVKAAITMGLYILHWALTALMFWLMWANREQTGAPPSFWDSLYFSFVTFSTIGFGDYNPDWHSWDVVPAYIATFIGLILFSELIAVGTEVYKLLQDRAVSKGMELIEKSKSSASFKRLRGSNQPGSGIGGEHGDRLVQQMLLAETPGPQREALAMQIRQQQQQVVDYDAAEDMQKLEARGGLEDISHCPASEHQIHRTNSTKQAWV